MSAPSTAARRWGLIGILALGAIGAMMAATIVNVALPSLIGAFGLGQDEAQWLSTAFLTSSTGFMLLNTWAIASFGMRASFATAMSVFIMGSMIGASAHDLATLVIGRVCPVWTTNSSFAFCAAAGPDSTLPRITQAIELIALVVMGTSGERVSASGGC